MDTLLYQVSALRRDDMTRDRLRDANARFVIRQETPDVSPRWWLGPGNGSTIDRAEAVTYDFAAAWDAVERFALLTSLDELYLEVVGDLGRPGPPTPRDGIVTGDQRNEHVDHPAHYGGAADPYEAIKVIEAWSLGFCLGNAVKYVSRAGRKAGADPVEDLKKAVWYINREIANREKAK